MSTSQKYILTGAAIVADDLVLNDYAIVIEDGLIQAIKPVQVLSGIDAERVELDAKHTLIPGRIDLHIHGANGADIMDATAEAFTTIGKALAQEGTTGYLATTLTASCDDIEATMQAVECYMLHQPGDAAQMLGIHLEGPFLSSKFAGAQEAAYFIDPNIQLFDHWQALSGANIKLVTVAPELPGAQTFIAHCAKQGVIASIGHTAATFKQTQEAIEKGCRHATHLYNAMSGIHHRQPGAAAAILYSSKVTAELICDFHHVAPEMIGFTYQIKGAKQLVLVTDSMRAKCLGDGDYRLGNLAVNVKDKVARLADGTLAGSILSMNDAVINTLKATGCSLMEAVQMTSVNPAKALGLWHQQGSLTVGKQANIVCLDQDYQVKQTWVKGRCVYCADSV